MLGDKYWTIRSNGDVTEFCAVRRAGPSQGTKIKIFLVLGIPIWLTLAFWQGAFRDDDPFSGPLAPKMAIATLIWVAILGWAAFPRVHGIRLRASPRSLSVLRYERGGVEQDLTFSPAELILRMGTRKLWIRTGRRSHTYRQTPVYELWG
jgi:hypothetical protein